MLKIERCRLIQQVTELHRNKSLIWMSGVRRVGKTTLCQSLVEAVFFDCELPKVRAQLEDPEFFWRQHNGKLVILDEVHRLTDPSNVLKIGTDHFKKTRIIATGSSTLAAKKKFKDTLTDRKRDLWIHPLSISELAKDPNYSLSRRLLHGGLPPAYFSKEPDDEFYTEWLESFWAKDVQELFSIDKKSSFLKLAELILRTSGEQFEATAFAGPCEISRPTVTNYLEILSTTLFAHIIRPFSEGRAVDIVAQPKVYGFDTGFVCFARGWDKLRPEDEGLLIEHVVLDHLLAQFGKSRVFYWRDKRHHEIDFVVKPTRGKSVLSIECKRSYQKFSPQNLQSFRAAYPNGENYVFAANITEPLTNRFGELVVKFLPLGQFIEL